MVICSKSKADLLGVRSGDTDTALERILPSPIPSSTSHY